MKKIRIGVMGCANIAQRSMIPALLTLNDKFELVGIASRNKEKLDNLVLNFDCKKYIGYDNLVNDENIDAIYMPLPTGAHNEWISKCLKAKKNVYAEKSIAMNHDEAQSMVKMAIQNDCALMEGYMFQYHTQHLITKKLLSENAIGNLRQYRATFCFPPFKDNKNFRYDNLIGGGALKDAAGYVVRSIEYLFPDRFKIKDASIYYDPKSGTSLYGSVYLVAEEGTTAILTFGFDNYYQCNYEILGSKGKITAEKAFTPKANETTIITVEKQGHVVNQECSPCNHFIKAMEVFYEACNNKERNILYNQILKQSQDLDLIERISKDSF